jgi:endonuclease YncB( thermonuclease family)
MRRAAAIAISFLILVTSLPTPPAASAQTMPEMVPPPSRDVTAPGVTPSPVAPGPLIREPPPAPAPEEPRWQRFFLPVATAAGKLSVGKHEVSLAGVVALAPGDACHAGSSPAWACGIAALAAFRLFLHNRAVECFLATTGKSDRVTAPCRVGKTDLGLWLLAQGWAMAAADAPADYVKAADAARCSRHGIWRDEAVAGCAPAE